MSGPSGSTDADYQSNGIPMVLRGNLNEGESTEHTVENHGVLVRQILREVAKMEDQAPVIGEKRRLTRRELEEALEKVKRLNRTFYKFAVEEFMKEVYEVTEKNAT